MSYTVDVSHVVYFTAGGELDLRLEKNGQTIDEDGFVTRVEQRQGKWFFSGKSLDGTVEDLRPEAGLEDKNFERPALLTQKQLDYLHAQGVNEEKVPCSLTAEIAKLGEGSKFEKALIGRQMDIAPSTYPDPAHDYIIFVTSPLEAVAYAQAAEPDYNKAAYSRYLATGSTVDGNTEKWIKQVLENEKGHGAKRVILAFPSTQQGETLAEKIKELAGGMESIRETPAHGKTWVEQERQRNPEVVRSAPAKYRERELER